MEYIIRIAISIPISSYPKLLKGCKCSTLGLLANLNRPCETACMIKKLEVPLVSQTHIKDSFYPAHAVSGKNWTCILATCTI